MEVAAAVTPCRHDAGPTVLDEPRQRHARGSAASLGGDVVGTDQIPVPLEDAGWTAKLAAAGLWDPPPAGGAGGGGAPFIHQPHHDACLFGLVSQGLHKVGAAPPPQPEVLHPTGVAAGDARGVPDHQGADPLPDRKGDDLPGSLVMRLVDAAAMARVDPPQPSPMATPAARPVLPALGRPAGGVGCRPAPCPQLGGTRLSGRRHSLARRG